MTIDLRAERTELWNFVSRVIAAHLDARKPKPSMIHFGFYFDQAGWISAYLDPRPNASRDGEWTTHLEPETLLPRPHWHEASELGDLRNLILIGMDGREVSEWSEPLDFQKLANVLGEFLTTSIAAFESEGLFQPLFESERVPYCVEELTGLYGWPISPEMAKFIESL